ncbi:MAG: diguanylate cyclase [gamma proteobacterium symbiont of Taylorina sp.]|nr:diguanylate cyclase [gamma proteobacterium symbiont of Taylorina sp.]
MPQFTKKLFTDLAIWMSMLGIIIGICFPPFTVILGFDPELSFSFSFWIICVIAGLLVAGANYMLVNLIIRKPLITISEHMHIVEKEIKSATYTGDWSGCTPEKCNIDIDSDDELGESARTFNDLVSALFRSHEVEKAVSEFSKALSAQLDLDLLSKKALELLLHHTGAVAGLVLTNQSGEQLITANFGLRHPEKIISSIHIHKAMTEKKVISVKLPEDVLVEAVIADFRPKEVTIVPIEFKDEMLGIVVLATASEFNQDALWMIDFFSQGFALSLKNAMIHTQIQQIAALDGLTGIFNRRFGMKRLNEEFSRAKRADSPLTVMMLDLDHFKKINDFYGHLVGDKVIISVVNETKKILRESDIIIRFGGEEFLVVLPGISVENAVITGDRICQKIEDHEIRNKLDIIKMTLSIGISCYPDEHIDSTDRLIQYADNALYFSKDSGRNRSTLYSEQLNIQ